VHVAERVVASVVRIVGVAFGVVRSTPARHSA
jgi:hypothetical protein